MRYLTCLSSLAIFVATPTWATDPPKPVTPVQQQDQNQMQNQGQGQEQTQSATATQTANGGTSSSGGNEFRTLAVGTTSPAPLHATPECYLPPKGIRRVRQALFGVVTLDPRLVRDAECMADIQAEREHELAVLQAQEQLENARTRRLTAERQNQCDAAAGRAIEACAAK